MNTIEIFAGLYTIAVLILGFVLDGKRGIPFPVTYSWGVAVALIAQVVLEATTGRGHISLGSAVMAILVTSFAVYLTAKKGL